MDVVSVTNPLARYDPDQPPQIPEKFRKTYKRSVYFPKRKATILYQVSEMVGEAARGGVRMTFNDTVIEALELWYKQNKRKHLGWLLYRLAGTRDRLAHEVENLPNKSKSTSIAELEIYQDKTAKAIYEIEEFLRKHQQTFPTGDYEMLVTEIVQSLKQHTSDEMGRALSKVFERSDISELAAQVRHKPKIEKKNTFSKLKDEEREWND